MLPISPECTIVYYATDPDGEEHLQPEANPVLLHDSSSSIVSIDVEFCTTHDSE